MIAGCCPRQVSEIFRRVAENRPAESQQHTRKSWSYVPISVLQ